MANSGQIKLYDFYAQLEGEVREAGYLEWSVISQSVQGNTSTIKWALYANYSYGAEGFEVWEYSVWADSRTIAYATTYIGFDSSETKKIKEGSFVVSHESDGSKSISLGAGYKGNEFPTSTSQIYVRGEKTIQLPAISRKPVILTTSNFTDEENPVITYSNPANGELKACISINGSTADIPYRTIPKNGSSYTFVLTDTDKNKLRLAAANSQSIQVTYLVVCTLDGKDYTASAKRTFTVVNCMPVLNNLMVKDIKPETLALTGDENKVIRYESMIEYSFTPVASKLATIVDQFIQCGNKKITGMSQGVIDDVESNIFTFGATDSRGLTATANVEKTLVDYLKPTCHQKLETEVVGETGAKVSLTISGDFFNGSFGVVSNTLKIELRHTQNDGTMGEWVDLTPLIYTTDGNTYELKTTITGLDYSQAYDFQSRVTDKLHVVQSSQYTIKVLPVFDWSNDDFNFNVPVQMNGETVLRHNKEADNTVLSASGGKIYLRPNGTNSTVGEVIINSDGSITSEGGTVGGSAADYITETGTEAMGSNGTWYWEKWASGKAVCWGSRNFGRMSVNTAWGALYRSGYQSQNLPSNLFNASPTNVHIQIDRVTYSEGSFPGFAMNSEKTSSQLGFVVVNAVAINLSESYIDFHIIGRWK